MPCWAGTFLPFVVGDESYVEVYCTRKMNHRFLFPHPRPEISRIPTRYLLSNMEDAYFMLLVKLLVKRKASGAPREVNNNYALPQLLMGVSIAMLCCTPAMY